MAKIKVVHIVDDLKVGGLERTLAMIVMGLDRSRYETEVWCLLGGGHFADRIALSGIPVRIFELSGRKKWKNFFDMVGLLRRERVAITHSWALSGGVWGRVASLCAGVKVRFLHTQSVYGQITQKDRSVERLLSYATTNIIACAEAVKKDLVDLVGIDPGKITVVYNAVDTALFRPPEDKDAARGKLGLSREDIIIGTVARLISIKGQSYIMQAIARLLSAFPGIKLLIVGDGPDRIKLEEEARGLGISEKVLFAGNREDMPELYAAMDIFVLASTAREGLPLTAAEALATSLPVVATDVGGTGEIVIDGETGLLVRPKDAAAIAKAIEVFLNDPEKARQMGVAGRKLCEEKFSKDAMIKGVEALYEAYL